MPYLLDTNAMSDLIRNPQGRVAQQIREVGVGQVCTSIIVAAELRYGAAKKASARLSVQVESVLGAIAILPLEKPVDRTYGLLRAGLERTGRIVGANDLLIASQAVTLGYTLVTDNEREFERVEGLKRENWLRESQRK
jgi:tRNA(fMet)-specific endonuclease VapC